MRGYLFADISEFTNREKMGRRGLEVLLRMRVPWSAGVVTTSRRAIRPFWSRRHLSPLWWLRPRKPLQKDTFLSSDCFFFISNGLKTIFADKFSIHGWLADETSKLLCSGCISPHMMRTTPGAYCRREEFTRSVSQFVILFSTWTYSFFTTVLYTRKSFQIKRFNSQFV